MSTKSSFLIAPKHLSSQDNCRRVIQKASYSLRVANYLASELRKVFLKVKLIGVKPRLMNVIIKTKKLQALNLIMA